MDNKDLFKKFYDELYKDILNEYYTSINDELENSKRKKTLTIIFLDIIPTILFWMIFFSKEYLLFFIVLTLIYNISLILFLKMIQKENRLNIYKEIKYKILDDFITLLSQYENISIFPNKQISKDSFDKSELFNLEKVNYSGSNFIQTSFENKVLTIADMEIFTYVDKEKKEYVTIKGKKYLRTTKMKQKKDIFKGCYLGSESKRKNDIIIQIVPDKLNKNKKYYRLCGNKIDFESIVLNDTYDVYSNDELKVRMILTVPMIEKINELNNIIDNPKYIIFKPDGRYSIFIEDMTIEKILDNIKVTSNDEERFENISNVYEQLFKLFMTVDIMNNTK